MSKEIDPPALAPFAEACLHLHALVMGLEGGCQGVNNGRMLLIERPWQLGAATNGPEIDPHVERARMDFESLQ